ncbi:hypothetical protein [Pelagicoccus sp. SDUM812005]|uniref:hypothetical protein n=1 Tax=Pelagicoccus sp. SDUM812005 TaxID=3041257 RepID=UPI00280D8AE0|nr:hypothetical protein [Pelagicoccus sp. SDUM812005]MDQ8180645.1 hypothetical protein [Pelagicoccus sp. SDUM812005]
MGILTPRATELRELRLGVEYDDLQKTNSPPPHDLVKLSLTPSIPWTIASNESEWQNYPASLLAEWAELKSNLPPEVDLFLDVSPYPNSHYTSLSTEWKELPHQPLSPPWDSYKFSSASVKTAYTNFLRAAIDYFEPDYISVAPRANQALAEAPQVWPELKSLIFSTHSKLAIEYPEVKYALSLDYETLSGISPESQSLLESSRDTYPDILTNEPASLVEVSNLIALSSLPELYSNDTSISSYYAPAFEYADQLGKPLAFAQIAFASQAFPPTDSLSPATQFEKLDELLLQAFEHRSPFIVYTQIADEGSATEDPREKLQYIAGLANTQGEPKPALTIWKSYFDIEFTDLAAKEKTTDSDSDGVFDAFDTAPHNPSHSSLHYYFEDRDNDSFGDAAAPIAVNSDSPPPSTSAWRGDPNDHFKMSTPAIHPKAGRTFGFDANGDLSQLVDHKSELQELGVDCLHLTVSWADLDLGNGDTKAIDLGQIPDTVELCRELGIKLSLTLNLIDGEELTVPPELRSALSFQLTSWSSEYVKPRFFDLIEAILEETGPNTLASIQLGTDIQTYSPDVEPNIFWDDLTAFIQSLHGYLDATCESKPKLGFRCSLDSTDNLNSLPTKLEELLTKQDFLGIDYQPKEGREPIVIAQDIEALLATLPNELTVRLHELAHSSSPSIGSSETKQSQFTLALFEIWDRYPNRIQHLGFTSLFDSDRVTETGFLKRDYSKKRAYHTLRTQSMNRGWWKLPAEQRRSYYLGFSHTPYDSASDLAEIKEVDDWMWKRIADDSDIVNLQLDGGIPWPEALADDLEGDIPPFSNDLLGYWEKLRREVPENHKRVVSFSPTGNPRSRLEGYWGYGRSTAFIDDDGFIIEPVGDYKETTDAFLPFPWSKLRFNDDPVKTALVNYAKRVIRYFEPDYLVVGLEASESIPEDPVRFDEYIELQTHLYHALKEDPDTAHIPLIVSVSSTSLMTDEFGVPFKFDQQPPNARKQQIEGLRRILPITDILGISHYPHFGKFNAELIPSGMYQSLFELLEELDAHDKPIAITESGYTADPFTIFDTHFSGSPEKQDLYMKHFLYEMEKSSHPVEFIINYEIRDTDYTWLRQKELADRGEFNPVFLQFFQYFRDIGLYDGEGSSNRPAYATWKNALQSPLLPKGALVSETVDLHLFIRSYLQFDDNQQAWLVLRYYPSQQLDGLNFQVEQTNATLAWQDLPEEEDTIITSNISAQLCDDERDQIETRINLGQLPPPYLFRVVVNRTKAD